MIELENETKYSFGEMIAITQREKNKKRAFLLANKKQAKHIPSRPSEALALFRQLGQKAKSAFDGERLLVIGFAETATAIGAVVAQSIGDNCAYLQTTREKLDCQCVVNFLEEHSHAVNQTLYCENPQETFQNIDRILFVEDEITTGKTIFNFVSALRQKQYIGIKMNFGVVSLLNCMTEENRRRAQREKVPFLSLVRISNTFDQIRFRETERIENRKGSMTPVFPIQTIPGKINPRTGVFIYSYCKKVLEFCHQIKQDFPLEGAKKEKILVVGTEEFSYPALILGSILEQERKSDVWVQGTTRSPIVPWDQKGYAVKNRSQIESLYEKNRTTFIYNLIRYDRVIILTDTKKINERGVMELVQALKAWGNQKIQVVRWVEE